VGSASLTHPTPFFVSEARTTSPMNPLLSN
jgi:hypothetical protein